jgi:hypothetical protein
LLNGRDDCGPYGLPVELLLDESGDEPLLPELSKLPPLLLPRLEPELG